MKKQATKSDAMITPLPTAGSRTTLRLRILMEQQQRIEIGQRIRGLREESPHTNASIADEVGVGERAVANWMSGGTGITYKNASKVADLFDVDLTWLWTGDEKGAGPNGPTPDPFATPAAAAGDQVEELLREIRAGQLEQGARLLRVERELEALRKQVRPAARRRSAGG